MNSFGSDRSTSARDSRPVGRAKSCTRCRQAKLACDARKTVNGPCSRCKTKELDCRFDANFKRVSTRKLATEISHELHALRATDKVHHSDPVGSHPTQGLEAVPENENKTSSAQVTSCVTDLPEHALSWLNAATDDVAYSYTLGKFTLDAHVAVELFQYFGMHHYPHALFLQPVTSLSDLLERSPLLFATIILTASQEQESFVALYHEVAVEHEVLLSQILRKAIQRIETIHALLLLCLWPVPQPHYFSNPAWNYVGLAVHAATQLHCHSPLGSSQESNGWPGFGLVAEGDVKAIDQARTWLGCFRVGTAVATFSGLPPPISTRQHMRSIDKALKTTANMVPSWWTTLFSILKTTNSIMNTLEDIEDHALHFSVTQMFSEQLDKLKEEHLAPWRAELEIEWCNAKLYLFALTFTTPAANADPSQGTPIRISRQIILQKAYEVASNLITEFAKLSQLDASESHPGGLLIFVPELYLTSLFNATTFLFRFMATFITRTSMQANQAMRLIVEAHKIFQSYPTHREFTRAAIHIEALIGILRQGVPAGMGELAVKNKLGASVMFDAIFHACRQRNIDPSTGRTLAVRQWKTVNETFAQRLPDVPAIKMQNNVRDVDGAKNTIESDQPSTVLGGENAQWWEEWDKYIDLFQVDGSQLDMDTRWSQDWNTNGFMST